MADFLDPAIKGTIGILQSIKKYAPGVKRVVLTSSSAAILHLDNHPPIYDESVWAPMTWEAATRPENAYKASKVSQLHYQPSTRTRLCLTPGSTGLCRESRVGLCERGAPEL